MPWPPRVRPQSAHPILCAVLVACAGPHVGGLGAGLPPVPPDDPELRARLVLLGDTGEPDFAEALPDLSRILGLAPERTAAVILGDVVYPQGIRPDPGDAAEDRRRLSVQIQALTGVDGAGPRALFLPGNHDWESGVRGLAAQAEMVRQRGGDWLPARVGCPGPDVFDALDGLLIVVLDTEWLIRTEARDPRCDGASRGTVSDSVSAVLAANAARGADADEVVVVGHHPFRSVGRHGGACDRYLCLYRAFKAFEAYVGLHGDPQDLNNPAYRRMRAALEPSMVLHPPVLVAGGHDHSLQLIDEGPGARGARYFAVSGAISKRSEVTRRPTTAYAHGAKGFMTLDLTCDGGVLLTVIELGADTVFTRWLKEGHREVPAC